MEQVIMKYALCNELFGNASLGETAAICKKAGYDGIEFAPFTVFGSFFPADVKMGLANIKIALAHNALDFAGFHWLLVDSWRGFHTPPSRGGVVDSSRPMSLTSPDKAQRNAACERLKLLLEASAELGGGVLVLGSPRQRSTAPGQSKADALALFQECLSSLAHHAAECNSTILVEALDHSQCDVINTLAEAEKLISAIASPGVSGMFDFHNCADETAPWDTLIRKYSRVIKHIHINEWDGGPPGSGDSDYAPSFRAIREIGFDGWMSMEIFSQPDDAESLVRNALSFMKKINPR
jgi:sugar phosphate isomerase/epimerase